MIENTDADKALGTSAMADSIHNPAYRTADSQNGDGGEWSSKEIFRPQFRNPPDDGGLGPGIVVMAGLDRSKRPWEFLWMHKKKSSGLGTRRSKRKGPEVDLFF